jgi:hypothetical protein
MSSAPIAELPQTHRRSITQKPELWPTITREGGSC